MTMTRFLAHMTSGRTSVVCFKSAKSRTHLAAFAASCPASWPLCNHQSKLLII